jgi:hypothetical protein
MELRKILNDDLAEIYKGLEVLPNKILPNLENWSAYTCQCWDQKHTQHQTGAFVQLQLQGAHT